MQKDYSKILERLNAYKKKGVTDVEDYFLKNESRYTDASMFYLTYRFEGNKNEDNTFGIVFMKNWRDIITYLSDRHRALKPNQIMYYGEVDDDTFICLQGNGEAWKAAALNKDDAQCLNK